MRILIIDDNPGIRVMIRKYLAQFGFHIDEAENYAQGLAIMSRIPPPDLVFLDLWLPDTPNAEATLVEGVKTIKRINPDAIVVVMTGDSAEHIANQAIEVGADAFRHKLQIDSQVALLRSVKAALESRRDGKTKQTGRELAEEGHALIEILAGLLPIDQG